MAWWNNAKLKTYSDVAALWETCRFPEKGKPVSTNIRLFKKDNGAFELRNGGVTFATIYPANFVELDNYNYIPVGIYKTIPIFINRIDRGRYRIAHVKTLPIINEGFSYFDWEYLRKKAPEFFDGIAFDLATGECLNRKADLKYRAIPEVSRQWKRDIGAWQRGWKVRQRMGVTEGYERDILALEHIALVRAILDQLHEERLREVVKCIKEQDFSVGAYVYLRHYGAMYNPNLDVEAGLKALFGRYRDDLRKIYGVFG